MGDAGEVSRGLADVAGRAKATAGPREGRDPRLFPLFAPLSSLQGVGPALARRLARLLGREQPRVLDLLFHLPRGLLDLAPRSELTAADIGADVALEVEILRHRPGFGRSPYRIAARAAGQAVDLVFFNARRAWLEERFAEGRRLLVHGRLQQWRERLQMVHPEPLGGGAGRIPDRLPVYPLTAELGQGQLRRLLGRALERLPDLPEWHRPDVLPGIPLPSFGESLRALHRGAVPLGDPCAPARQRLALDELLALQLALAMVRMRRRREAGRALVGDGSLSQRLLEALPYRPTAAQLRAFAEIREDMAAPAPMMRLLQGDVGSGKTLVALLAMLTAVEAGHQAVLMAPTEILARQHAAVLGTLVAPLGLEVGLLTGREPPAARRRVVQGLASGSLGLCVGTQALVQPHVEIARLGLVVIDEQHRFGVGQRLALVAKGGAADLLLLTATPIPRSLLLCWYGDIAGSRLEEKPAGRKPVTTRAVSLSRLEEVVEAVGRALARGERGYWICPAVSAAESGEVAAAEARHAMLAERFGDTVGLVHGGLAKAAKQKAMRDFAAGRIRLLVATTVVEVGVDVPEAGLMVIEQAERFGLAQLHQLRGRVGRGDRPASCLLLYRPPLSATARARLRLLRETEDGFRIAEEDMRLRGPGEVLGVRQSGLPEFRFADLARHETLLRLAAEEARSVLAADPRLTGPRGRALRLLLELFGYAEAARLLGAG